MAIAEQLNAALADRYVIDREIGSGGMAIVYLAHDVRHDRPVALKVLNPELGAVLGATRFLEEIRVTANLQHPNLLPLFDSGATNGLLFYVMPYVEGESLRSRLTREKQLPIDEAVRITASIASALEYAHRQGVIHRDLKPENILLQAGQPMVADFGIALAVKKAGGARVTQTGISLGTPQYMSPEQATGDRVVDGRSDIYSLAAMLYEMLTGDPPHSGNTVQSIIARVLTERAPSVRMTRPNVPEDIASAISRGLEKLAADRWATPQAFADALTGGRGVAASDSAAFVSRRSPRSVSRRQTVLLATMCVIVGVGLAIGIGKWLPSQRPLELSTFDLALPDSVAPSVPDGGIALSPDGSTIAYVGSASHSLFVRPVEQLTPRRIAGTNGANCPSFSPDSRWIVFTSNGHLHKVAVAGGSPILIADSAGVCGVWTDRDEILYDFRGQLFRVSANGGPVSVVARSDTSKRIGTMMPSHALPGGNGALINVSESFSVDFQVGVVSMPDGKITKLTPSGMPRFGARYADGHVVFLQQNGRLVAAPFSLRKLAFTGPEATLLDGIAAFDAAENGKLAYLSGGQSTYSLVAVSRGGGTRMLGGNPAASGAQGPAALPLDTAHYSWPRLSPDGKRVALEMRTGPFTWDVWVFDIGSRTLARLTSNFTGIRPSGWTEDGRNVVFIALDSSYKTYNAPRRVVSQRWDGSAPPVELMRIGENVHDVNVGPPHGYAAFTVIDPGQSSDIWIVPLDTATAGRPIVATRAFEGEPRLSPDGKALAYLSNETGRAEVYVMPVTGPASRLQVSARGGIQPVWSRDGRQLYYRAQGYMMRASIARGSEFTVTLRDTLFRDVFALHNIQNYDVFPGGQELLMITETPSTPHAAIVLNWPKLLRQRPALR